MKNTRLMILGLALIMLVIVAYVIMQKPGERSATPGQRDRVTDIDSAQVTALEIVSPTQRIEITKQGAEWRLQEPLVYRADQGVVGTLISQLQSLRSRGIVSTNPEKQALFRVDSTGTIVTVEMDAGPPVSLVIGKMGTAYTETYVRVAGSNEVHLVNASLSTVGTRSVDEWRDKIIMIVPREDIRSVQYQYGDTTFTLAFQDSVWVVGGVPADNATVNMLLTSLAEVRADGFIDTPPVGHPAPSAIVSYGGRELRFYEVTSSDEYRVQSSAGNQWFDVKAWRAGQILKRKDDLREKTP